MISFFLSLLIVILVHTTLYVSLSALGIPSLYIMIICDLVMAVLFTLFNYRGRRKEAIKDPAFHRNIAIWFAILLIIDIISAVI